MNGIPDYLTSLSPQRPRPASGQPTPDSGSTVAAAGTASASTKPKGQIQVNLLPPQIYRRAQLRRARGQAGVAVAAVIAVVFVAFWMAMADKGSADSELAAAQQRLAAIDAQKKQFSDVPGVYNAIAKARNELATAMSQEVRFSSVLTDLGTTIPATASISSVMMAVGPGVSGSAGAKPGGKQAGAASTTDLGSANFIGQAASMPDVAVLMDALAAQPQYSSVHLDSAQVTGDGGYVNYTISAKFTEKALSGRFTMPTASGSGTASGASTTSSGSATASPTSAGGGSAAPTAPASGGTTVPTPALVTPALASPSASASGGSGG